MNVDVTVRGPVDPRMVDLAQERLADLETAVGRSLGQARIVLQQEKDGIPDGALAEGEVSLGGKIIRANVKAENMAQAVHDCAERLRQQIRRHTDRLTTQRRKPAEAPKGTWDHGNWRPVLPSQSRLQPDERDLIRRKVFAVSSLSAIEAAELMRDLDHAFYLFHDSDTGADSVVYIRDDGRLGVIAPQGVEAPTDGDESDVIVREQSRYSGPIALIDAVREMNELNHRFMFYVDVDTGRGAVLYLRHDGHYGLIQLEAGR